MEDGGADGLTKVDDEKSPERTSRSLMRLAENWLMAIKTGDSAVLRTEMCCFFEARDSFCDTCAEAIATVGALEVTFGIGHSPPSKPHALLLQRLSHFELFRMANVHTLASQQSPKSYLQPELAQPISQMPFPRMLRGQVSISQRQSPPSY